MPPGQPNGGGFGTDALAFGLMNSLRTGNALVDMTLCSLVTPALQSVGVVVESARPLARRLADFVRRRGRVEYRRVIRHERRLTHWGSESASGEQRNNILQKAITLYLSREHGLGASKRADYKLMAVGEEKFSGYRWNPTYGSTAAELEQ